MCVFQVFNTAQKMKFSIKEFFGKCDQIRKSTDFLRSVIQILFYGWTRIEE